MKRRGSKPKNPCDICGKPTDATGWCGSSDHDAGNPFGGIKCFVVTFPKREETEESRVREGAGGHVPR